MALAASPRSLPGRSAAPHRHLGSRGLVDRTVEQLGTEIVSGRLQPGDRLPIEADWCVELGVSRTVLREAVSVLASKGLIETKPRVGGRVCPRERWHRLDPAVLRWQIAAGPDDAFTAELFELRRLIEPPAAAFAAERADAGFIHDLEVAFQEMTAGVRNVERFLEPDSRFHQTILAAVGNSLIAALGGIVGSAVDLSLSLSLNLPEGQVRALPLHRAVLDAIATHRPAEAGAAMRRLIDEAEADVRRARRAPPSGKKRK